MRSFKQPPASSNHGKRAGSRGSGSKKAEKLVQTGWQGLSLSLYCYFHSPRIYRIHS